MYYDFNDADVGSGSAVHCLRRRDSGNSGHGRHGRNCFAAGDPNEGLGGDLNEDT